MTKKKSKQIHQPSQVKSNHGLGALWQLEPRMMFDGAAVSTSIEIVEQTLFDSMNQQTSQNNSADHSTRSNLTSTDTEILDAETDYQTPPIIQLENELEKWLTSYEPPNGPVNEIVFVDTHVENYETILAGINPNIQIVLLDNQKDGVKQMADYLTQHQSVEAIHIISHGSSGSLQLGTGSLTLNSMTQQYSVEMAVIKQALTEQADILIYGCDFAKGQVGQEAAILLGELAGAEVAASNNVTGHINLGGDWDLEVMIGTIETQVAVSEDTQANWKGLLAETWMNASTGAVIAGPAGNDWYVGDSANNAPTAAGSGNDIMYGAEGDDNLQGGSGDDILIGGTGNDTLSGNSNDDVILGGAGNDYLDGGSAIGKNTIIGGGGNDQMVGGTGVDVFRFTGAQSGDAYTVNGGDGADIIDLSEFSTATITNSGGVITVDRGGGNVFTINHSNVETIITGASVGNHGPLADAGVDQTVATSSTVTLTGAGSSDQDGNTLTYQWTQIEGPKVTLSSSTAASPTFTAPGSATTLQFIVVVSDGTASHADTVTINVGAVSNAPTISNLSGDSLSYTEGAGAVVIDQDANTLVVDADSANFDTGALTVSIPVGAEPAEDVLSIRNQGAGAGQIGISGSNISYGGLTIGTFTGGSGGNNLVITFNSNATPTTVTALIKNITFEDINTDSPAEGALTIRFVLTDGDGGISTNYDVSAWVTGVSDAPVNSIPGAQSTNEDTNLIFSSGNSNQISITDTDANSNSIEVTVSVTNGKLTLAGTTGLTFTTGDGTIDSTMTFHGTVTAINTALNGLTYIPTAEYNGGATLTLASRDNTLVSLDIDANLQARYTFEGTTNDVAPGTAQNGTLFNGGTYVTDGTRGQVLSLDGVDDYAQITGTVIGTPPSTEVTIGGWVNLAAGSGRKEFISLDNRVHIALDDASGVKGSIQVDASSWIDLHSNQFIAGTGWHHVMYTYSDSTNTHSLYIDGARVASATIASSVYWSGATDTYIGRHPTNGTWNANAKIDDVRIYNRALSANEISALASDLSLTDTDTVAITVNAVNDAPSANAAGPYAISEGQNLVLNAGSSSDPEGDTLTYAWDLDNDGNYGEVDEPTTVNPTVTWATLQSLGIADNGSYTIGLRVSDGTTPVTTTATINVSNTAPTLNVTGSATANSGGVYTLNLSDIDPGNDTISSWIVNWGDGSIGTYVGDPSSVTHTYSNGLAGFTFSITASAIDEDGQYYEADMWLPAYGGSELDVVDGYVGNVVDFFAVSDGLIGHANVVQKLDGNFLISGHGSSNVLEYQPDGTLVGTFVTAGSGGLNGAAGMDFGADGNLYITSSNSGKVLRFDGTTGAFIDEFVSSGLNFPLGLTFGPDGDLYVASQGSDGVLKFDGVTGILDATFNAPPTGSTEDITFGPDGNLYVSSLSNGVFRLNGTTGALIDNLVVINAGGLSSAAGVEFGPDGNLYVSDQNANAVRRYDGTTGAYIDDYIAPGGVPGPAYMVFTADHQVTVGTNAAPSANAAGPYAIAEGQNLTLNAGSSSDPEGDTLTYAWDLDNDGNYGEVGEPTTVNPTVTWATLQSFGIADNGSYTIGLRVSDGTTPVTTTTTVNVSNTAPTLTVTGNATASNGGVYTLNLSTADPGADTISGWTINWGDGTVQAVAGNPSTVTHSYSNVGLTYNILATATDEDGTFTDSKALVSSFGNDSVRQLDGVTGALLGTLPVNASLDNPGGSVIGPDGRLYVSGYGSNNIVWYDLGAGTTGVFVTAGSGGLSSVADVVFGRDGNLYVTSYNTDQVLRYNGATGAFIGAFATGTLNGPTGLTFGADGHLYVGDWFGGKVYKFDGVSGAQIGAGAFATLPSGFGVASIEFGSDGHLYVGDGQVNDLLKFNGTTGAFMSTIDASITPYDIETGPDGTLYVTDFTTGRVGRFDPTTGTSLGFFDTGTTGIVNPWGLAFTPELQVTVVDSVAPTITNLTGDSLAYSEGDGVVVIEQGGNATVSDVDSANFDTGMLTVSIPAGGDSAEDVLSIRNQGTGAGQIGVSGSTITYGGATIGTFTGGSSGSNLIITLNSSATPTSVTALVQNVTYENTDTSTPTAGARTIRFTLSDGDGGTSANYDTTVTVSAANDAPTFEVGDGQALTSFGTGWEFGKETIIQPDGKILVGGYSDSGGTDDFSLVRYNADGTLDNSFGGGDGVAFPGIVGRAEAMVLQADGKVVLSGYTTTGGYQVCLVRFNADGSLDTSFGGGDGVASSGVYGSAKDVALQTDGKFLVAADLSNSNFNLMRFNSDGALDTSFGGGSGYVSTDLAGGNDRADSLTIQSDGKVLLSGFGFNGTSFDFGLVRYNTDGSLDTSFNGTGKVLTDFGANSSDMGNETRMQADGKIVVVGWSNTGGTNDFAIARYNTNGTLDTGFGTGGKVTINLGNSDFAEGLTIQSDGKILVTGTAGINGGDVGLARLNTDGTLDTTFGGGDGIVTTDYSGSSDDRGYSVAVQSDGQIVVSGTTQVGGGGYNVALNRYSSTGSLDTTLDPVNTLNGTPTYTEGGSPVALDADVQIFDAELSVLNNFSGAILALVRNGGASADDIFSATGTLSLSSGNVIVNGTTIGTYTNAGGTLTFTFNSNATQMLVNSAMQQIAYSNSSDVPPASVQIDWTFSDGNTGAQGSGGALAATGSTTVSITAVNDVPTITNLSGDSLSYAEGDGAVVIEQGGNTTVSDVDSANFDTGTLTVSISAGGDSAEDVLSIRNQGTGAGQIGVSGSTITYGGATIGTFTGGSSGSNLAITLNSSATPTAVTALVQNVTYENTDTSTPTTGARTVRFTLADGDGGTSANYDTTVTVSGVNNAPILTNGGSVGAGEDSGGNPFFGGATITDPDSADFNGGTLTASISAGGESTDKLRLLAIGGVSLSGSNVLVSGVTVGTWSGGTSGTPLAVSFNASAQAAQVQAVYQSITYTTTSDAPTLGVRTISVVVTDGDGGTSNTGTGTVNLTATSNDQPVFSNLNGTPTYTEGGAAVVLDADVQIFDAELSVLDDFDGAMLTLARNGGTNAEDQLVFDGTVVTVSGLAVSVSGVQVGTYTFTGGEMTITFNGNATQALVNTLMQHILYYNVSDTPPASAQINWTFSDGNTGSQGTGGALQATGSTTVNVTAANDAPTDLALSANTVAENAANGTSIGTVSGTDPDSGDTQSYSLTDTAGGRFAIDSSTGEITVANGTLLNYEAAASHSVTVRVTDSGGLTYDETFTVNLTDGNEAPINIVPGSLIVNRNTPLTLGGIFVSDTNDDLSTVQLVVEHGTLKITLSGTASISAGGNGTSSLTLSGSLADINVALASLIYQSNYNYIGIDTLNVISSDSNSTQDIDAVVINVVYDNNLPVGLNDSYTLLQDSIFSVEAPGLLINDSDADDNELSITPMNGPENGTLVMNSDGSFIYTPNKDFVGVDSFTYVVHDGYGNSSPVTVMLTVNPVVLPLPETPSSPIVPITPPSTAPTPAPATALPSPVVQGTIPSIVPATVLPAIQNLLGPAISHLSGSSTENARLALQPAKLLQDHANSNLPEHLQETSSPISHALLTQNTVIANQQLWEEVENIQIDIQKAFDEKELTANVASVAGISLTAGIVGWLIRSGSMLASLLSIIPAWKSVDPLSIVVAKSGKDTHESLEDDDDTKQKENSAEKLFYPDK